MLPGIAGTAINPKLSIPFLGLVLWFVALVVLGEQVGAWTLSLATPTVFLFILVAIPMFGDAAGKAAQPGYFRERAWGLVGLTLISEFYLNLYTFNLFSELVLLLSLSFLTMMTTIARKRPELRPASVVSGLITAGIVVWLAIYTGTQFYQDRTELDSVELVRSFTLPVWIGAGLLPFVYLLSVYASYDTAFARIKLASTRPVSRIRTLCALGAVLRLRRQEVAGFAFYDAKRAAEAATIGEALAAVQTYVARREEQRRREQERRDTLIRFAGVRGTDEHGRQLDRREFEATRLALRTLNVAQDAAFRRDGRYSRTVLSKLEAIFLSDGLPAEHGVEMSVSGNSQSWWAWRRTVTGWVFAIGASSPLNRTMFFDGPEPPLGPPGTDEVWADELGSNAANWW